MTDDVQAFNELYTKRIYASPVEHYSTTQGRHLDKIVLGYAHLREEQIYAGVRALFGLMGEVG